MILHIHDKLSLFTKHAIKCFKEASIQCDHIILGAEEESTNLLYFKLKSKEYYDFIERNLFKYNLIVFHSLLLSNETCLKDVVKRKHKNTKLVWVVYGAEIQNNFIIPSSFLQNKTRFLYYFLLPYRIFVPFYRLLRQITGRSLKSYYKELDFYAHFMIEEIDFVIEKTGVKKEMLWHTYAMIEDFINIDLSEMEVVNSGNILVGNSASFTSNHTEVLKRIKKLNIENRRIIVPLSYGNRTYRNFIVKKGNKMFGDSFFPLIDFLPREDYYRVLLGCSVMILNHDRQQALGNIVAALWLGMRVYVNDYTTTYRYFKKAGLHVFSIQKDFKEDNPHLFLSLAKYEILENQEALKLIFGKENVVNKLRESFGMYSN